MSLTLRRAAAAGLAATGAIHLALAPEYLGEKLYVGVLFILGGLVCAVLAARLWRRDDPPAWILAALTAAGMGIGFVLSRTIGLPGFKEAGWEPSGILTLLLEAGVLAAAGAWVVRAVTPRGRTDGGAARLA